MVRKKISPGTGTRRKIPIEKIEDKDARHVCFSKRRNGIFTKASHLATLCGAEIVIVINSIADNLYSFGSPNVSQVIDRYLADDDAVVGPPEEAEQSSQRASAMRLLNDQCMTLGGVLEAAVERKSALERRQEIMSQQNEICKLFVDFHHVGLNDLEKLKKSLDGLMATAMGRINGLLHEKALSTATATASCPRKVGVARARLANNVIKEHKFI